MCEKDFIEVIEAICKNPNTYTKSGSFYEVVIFLEGYAMGANIGDNNYHSKFTPFHQWIVGKFHLGKLFVTWTDFREIFSTDSDALKELSVLYKEYVESIA
jgi:hypothetical protein